MNEEDQYELLPRQQVQSDQDQEDWPVDYWVYKRNELVFGQYDLSAAAQKTFAAVLSQIDPRASGPLPVFTMGYTECAGLLDVSPQYVRREMDKITDELQGLVARLPFIDTEYEKMVSEEKRLAKAENRNPVYPPKPDHVRAGSFEKVSFFYRSKVDAIKKQIIFEFHPLIEPYVRDFTSHFTRYQLRHVLGMNRKYSIRIYEMLRSTHTVTRAIEGRTVSERKINYQELRHWLGIDDDKYPQFSKFKEKVLIPAQRDLDLSDLNFEFILPEREKSSQAPVTYIKFRIISKSFDDLLQDEDAIKRYLTVFVGKKSAAALWAKFSPQVIRDNMIYAQNLMNAGNNIKNYKGFLIHAIKMNVAKYGPSLDPRQYNSESEADFVRTVLPEIWTELSEEERQAFTEEKFRHGPVAELYRENLGNSSADKKRRVRSALRNIQDTDW